MYNVKNVAQTARGIFKFCSFNHRHNEVNATNLNEWLKYAIATNGKFLVRVCHAVGDVVPPLPVGCLAPLEQCRDGDRVN